MGTLLRLETLSGAAAMPLPQVTEPLSWLAFTHHQQGAKSTKLCQTPNSSLPSDKRNLTDRFPSDSTTCLGQVMSQSPGDVPAQTYARRENLQKSE